MNDTKAEPKRKKTEAETGSFEPVHTIRHGAIAASVWLRQSPSGYGYLDFSLSRSWKSMSTEKAGYSRNFFARNKAALIAAIEETCAWVEHEEKKLQDHEAKDAKAA